MSESVNNDYGLVGLSRAQSLQLKYYMTAVSNYNKRKKEHEPELEVLITPFASKALSLAYKNLLDLPQTIKKFNEFQIRCEEENKVAQIKKKEELDRILNEVFLEFTFQEAALFSTDDGQRSHSMFTRNESILREVDTIYSLSLEEDDIREVNESYNDIMSYKSYVRVRQFLGPNYVDDVLKTYRISFNCLSLYLATFMFKNLRGDYLMFTDELGSLTVQDSREIVCEMIECQYINLEDTYEKELGNYSTNKELLLGLCSLLKISVEEHLSGEQWWFNLGNLGSYHTFDLTDQGLENLYDDVLVSLGYGDRRYKGLYYKMVDDYSRSRRYHKQIIVYYSEGGTWKATMEDHEGTVFGYTYYHVLNRLFEYFDPSWFYLEKSSQEVHCFRRFSRTRRRYFVGKVYNSIEKPVVTYKNLCRGFTDNVEGIELMFSVLNLSYAKSTMPLDEWHFLAEKTLSSVSRRLSVLVDSEYYVKRIRGYNDINDN